MKKSGAKIRGFGLATSLGMTGIIVLICFVTVAACFAQLTFSTRSQRLSEAELAADSVAQLASARLLSVPNFGLTGNATEKSLELQLSEGRARLSFDQATAERWGVPLSRNNLANETAMPGFQRTIPPKSVQLLALGESGGRRRVIEVIVNQPPFKWAIASTGNLHSSGGMQVFGVKDFGLLANGINNLPPDQILPGHLVSNSTDAQALQLDSTSAAPTLVTGDAQASGGLTLGPSTTVNGQLKPNSDPAKLPELAVENYDPYGITGLQEITQSSASSTLGVSGIWRRSGDLTVSQGGLALDQGYLYVDGDLEVWGGLSGKGAVFATGNVTVHGVSQFSANSLQAIIAKGDLSLSGTDPDNSSFQGLLMSGKRIRASQVSVVGTLIGTSREAGGSSVELDQVKLVSNPQAIHLDFPKLLMGHQDGLGISFDPQTPDFGPLPQVGASSNDLNAWGVPDPNLDPLQFYNPTQDALDRDSVSVEDLHLSYVTSDGHSFASFDELQNYARRNAFQTHMPVEMVDGRALAAYQEGIDKANLIYRQGRRNGLPPASFSLDPNSFIQASDKMRRLLWRVVE